jgi:hypothetical protein
MEAARLIESSAHPGLLATAVTSPLFRSLTSTHPVPGLRRLDRLDLGAPSIRAVCGRARGGGREASPTVAIIDSQTAKGAQKGGLGLILRATTRARRSRVASGTSWSTRWVSC